MRTHRSIRPVAAGSGEIRASRRIDRRPRAAALGSLTLLAALLAGCKAQRMLEITSTPSECEVRVDGERVGATPMELPFEHYGQRRVSIYREGYRTWSRVVKIKPPWYGRFPFDLISEVLVPVGWRDVHRVHATLQPGVSVLLEPDLQEVLDRAEAMRRAGPEGPKPVESSASKTESTKPSEPKPGQRATERP